MELTVVNPVGDGRHRYSTPENATRVLGQGHSRTVTSVAPTPNRGSGCINVWELALQEPVNHIFYANPLLILHLNKPSDVDLVLDLNGTKFSVSREQNFVSLEAGASAVNGGVDDAPVSGQIGAPVASKSVGHLRRIWSTVSAHIFYLVNFACKGF